MRVIFSSLISYCESIQNEIKLCAYKHQCKTLLDVVLLCMHISPISRLFSVFKCHCVVDSWEKQSLSLKNSDDYCRAEWPCGTKSSIWRILFVQRKQFGNCYLCRNFRLFLWCTPKWGKAAWTQQQIEWKLCSIFFHMFLIASEIYFAFHWVAVSCRILYVQFFFCVSENSSELWKCGKCHQLLTSFLQSFAVSWNWRFFGKFD